jgi:DNA (cytosine-5)-methyltransferase 1
VEQEQRPAECGRAEMADRARAGARALFHQRRGEPWESGRDSRGTGRYWTSEPNVGRVANGVPSRVDRLRCLGNAVVPQVAEYIGRMIVDANER